MFGLFLTRLSAMIPGRKTLITRFPVIFPRPLHELKSKRDLIIAGLTRMHLWPAWITPNKLSFVRLLSAVPLIALMVWNMQAEALLIFSAGSILDLFDGPLARLRDGLHRPSKRHLPKLEGVSGLGSYLDPMADKAVAVCVCMIALVTILLMESGVPNGYRISDDAYFQKAYMGFHIMVLSVTAFLETWSALKRTGDYLRFRRSLCPLERLQATSEGKWKAVIQFFGTGGYVIAAPWSLLAGLILLTGSLTLAVKSLWSKYRPAIT